MFEDKRKPHQKISNPSRNRPYNSITSLQKEYAFVILKHINKILHQKHFRLIAKLESNYNKPQFEDNSEVKEQLNKAINYIKLDWTELD